MSDPYAGTSSYGMGGDGTLRPDDYAYFANSRRTINDQYNMGSSNLSLQNNYANQNYGTRLGDVTRFNQQQTNQLPGSYAGRGLLNSGIYSGAGGALDRLQQNQQSSLADLSNQHQYQQSAYSNNMGNLGVQQHDSLDNLATSQGARQAATAGAIGGM